MKNRIIAWGLATALSVTAFAPAAMASENAAKNAAIGATVVSALLLMNRNTRTAGYVGAAGSAYLWKKYGDSRRARRAREQARARRYRAAAYRNARAAKYYRTKYYQASRRTHSTRYARR